MSSGIRYEFFIIPLIPEKSSELKLRVKPLAKGVREEVEPRSCGWLRLDTIEYGGASHVLPGLDTDALIVFSIAVLE